MINDRKLILDGYRDRKFPTIEIFNRMGCRSECIYSFFDFFDGVSPRIRARIRSELMSMRR